MTQTVQNSGKTLRLGTVVCLASLVLLGACREEEQGRLQSFEPGVYQGVEDTELDQETIDALRSRAMRNTDP